MFRLKHLPFQTQLEHVVAIHEDAIREGNLGFNLMDRVCLLGEHPGSGERREIVGVLAFCRGEDLVARDEIGVSDITFADLGLPEGTAVHATIAPAPKSIDRVREKLRGRELSRADFDAIMADVVAHRYTRVDLAMFVLGCGLTHLGLDETIAFTRAMIAAGRRLSFDGGPVVDKHCIGGVPGNRTTLVMVPILAALGLVVPKTSSKAITSPAGTADTMSVLADVALDSRRLHAVVKEVGCSIAWGGALDLAPADDILITVERPMEIDTVPQMVASILAKKKTAGATHVLIDIPVGRSAKVRTVSAAHELAALFRKVADAVGIVVALEITEAKGPVGFGIGPRLEALDTLAVLRGNAEAPQDLREKSLFLAGRLLEMCAAVEPNRGYRTAREVLDSGAALAKFEQLRDVQGRREIPPEAAFRHVVAAPADGRIASIDCWRISRVAKRAGAPAAVAAGVRLIRTVGDVVEAGEPLFEIHAPSEAQLGFARDYAAERPGIVTVGY